MRILLLGVTGMLGHKLWQRYKDRYETWATVRGGLDRLAQFDLFISDRILPGIDVLDFDSIVNVFQRVRPDVVINCVGITDFRSSQQRSVDTEAYEVSIALNSLLPHRLSNLCRLAGCRLIHISTDCVFSGTKGMYTEDDVSDATDLYGRSKYLGEVSEEGCITLRTSIIGRELGRGSGLVEWFLSNDGKTVSGFRKVIYTGFTTAFLSKIIADLIEKNPKLSGLYHVSSKPINKYDLLHLLRDAFSLDIVIEEDTETRIDRSLDSTRFRVATGLEPTTWADMIREMAEEQHFDITN
jgi:dTDP-4-dehydrorhamnose reductase